ncbi:hypothetical protein B0I35DRAFT_405783 [Stachybotrys elegans]|uniref:Uncharacterized protein n=1 Tax=Stachybotrys elegans TaxID=80388 RepID=A0A8K0WWJ3_9HYPO|nr:hypothetical protein B0I35DRAFT_405783 [Stachybotrys elegans]
MSSRPADDVEILVHIAAPSRAADDDTYRRLARAHLAFVSQQRTDVASLVAPSRTRKRKLAPSSETSTALSSSIPSVPPPPPPPSTLPQSSVLEVVDLDLSFASALDNRSSPRLPNISRGPVHQDAIAESQETAHSSWSAPPSHISDSYPLPDSGILHVSPTRVLQRYLHHTNTCVPSSPLASPSPHDSGLSTEIASSPGIHIPSSIPDPNVESGIIPVTPHVAKTAAQLEHSTAGDDDAEAAHDITHVSNSFVSQPSIASSFRSGSEPPPSKRPRTTGQINSSLALIRSASDSLHVRPRTAVHVDDTLVIRPPDPSVAVDDLEPADLVSDKLAKLSKDLSSRYRPLTKRDIEPLERGYWLLDCAAWSLETKVDTWAFLTNYLQSGIAGWGVWCSRDPAHRWIRMYCWGHLSKHTYLLLYLASARLLKTTGASWIDGDGNVVIQVPPHDKQQSRHAID